MTNETIYKKHDENMLQVLNFEKNFSCLLVEDFPFVYFSSFISKSAFCAELLPSALFGSFSLIVKYFMAVSLSLRFS